MMHAPVPADVHEEPCIPDNLVRLSLGVEDLNELIAEAVTTLAAMDP